jgi:four helix bundle protein
MYKTDLKKRTFDFAQTLLALYPRIAKLGRPYEHIAFQLFTAGSSVGAHLQEGEVAVSNRDKRHKHVIALRESRESAYWLGLLIGDRKMVDELKPLFSEASEFVAMLTTSVKKLGEKEDD